MAASLSLREQIISKVLKLNDVQAEQLLLLIDEFVDEPEGAEPSLGQWLEEATAFRKQLREKYGDRHFDIQSDLDAIREERS